MGGKHEYGSGSITLERGKWRVRVPDGKGGTRSIGAFGTPELARTMRNAALGARHELGVGMTMRRYGDVWLHSIRDQHNHGSTCTTWSTIVHDAPFMDVPMGQVVKGDLRDWVKTLPKKRAMRTQLRDGVRTRVETSRMISRQTAQHAFGYVRRAFAAAIADGHLEENPCDGVELPDWPEAVLRHGVDQIVALPITYLPEDELEDLLDCEGLPLEQRTVFTISTHQGLREGEIAGLDWERCDWEAHGWWVARSWNRGTTKTGSVRWQAWLPRTEAALRAWWQAQGCPTRGIVFPSPWRADDGSLRRYAKGHDWGWADHPSANWYRLGWWRRCGLRTQVRLHDHRDTAATHLLSGTWAEDGKGWTIEEVSEFLGHTSIEVTRRRYAHVTRQAKQRAARKMTRGGMTSASSLTAKSEEGSVTPRDGSTIPATDAIDGAPPSRVSARKCLPLAKASSARESVASMPVIDGEQLQTPAADLPHPPEKSHARSERKSLRLLMAPPPRVELGTFGLGSGSSPNDSDGLADSRQVCGRFDQNVLNLARAFLEGVAAGGPVPGSLVTEFGAALAELAQADLARALEVLAGGQRAFDKAFEVARDIVRASGIPEGSTARRKGAL